MMHPGSTAVLEREIAAFEKRRPELESEHKGEWAVFHGADLCGLFASFDDAAQEAVKRFGRGPFLIRQVGAAEIVLPASVMSRIFDASD